MVSFLDVIRPERKSSHKKTFHVIRGPKKFLEVPLEILFVYSLMEEHAFQYR